MLNYSLSFNGWFGKMADDFTYEKVYRLAFALSKYYKKNSTPGQKLIVGYDTRVFAKEFAEFLSCVMAENGVKVFLSNKAAPSSVLVVSSLHKKSMGAVVLTGDQHDYRYMGIKAYSNRGYSLNEHDLEEYQSSKMLKKEFEYSLKKWTSKGFVEPFDPSISYMQNIEQAIDFNRIASTSRILFNPLHGSGMYYFDRILNEKGLRGYTVDNESTLNFKGMEPSPSLHITQLYDDMVFHGSDLGYILSPDCCTFHFLIEPHQLTTKETLFFLLESFILKGRNGKILLSDTHEINIPSFAKSHFEFVYVKEEDFQKALKSGEYTISIDSFDRFYFENHGAPDALLCGYYLIEILNNKELTPKMLHQKLNKIKGV